MFLTRSEYYSFKSLKKEIFKQSIYFLLFTFFVVLFFISKSSYSILFLFLSFLPLYNLYIFNKNVLNTFSNIEECKKKSEYFSYICLESESFIYKKDFFKINKIELDVVNSLDSWLSLIYKEDQKSFKELINEYKGSFNKNRRIRYRLKHKNLSYEWIESEICLFIENKKKYLYISYNNINNEKELKDINYLMTSGQIITFRSSNNNDYEIKNISESISSFFYSQNDFLSLEINLLEFIYFDDILYFTNSIKKAEKNNDEIVYLVFRVKDKKSNIKWVSSRIILIKDQYNKVFELYGYIADITKLKLNEIDLKEQIENEVEQNIKKDRLLSHQNKLASMGEMLGNIAHQWRQPLNNISLLAYFLRDNYYNDEFTKENFDNNIEEIKLQISFMSNTIDDFRNFYKPNKEKKKFSVIKAFESSYKIVKSQFESSGTLLKFNNNDIEINTYENEFQQVIVNILNNSNDAALNKLISKKFLPLVEINILELNNKIMIEIENNCGKANKEVISRMFEPYFTTKFENKGTGIGLYMCKIIIEKNMSGSISALNTTNGLKFIIILPI